ncbi:hypothetical protein MPL1032_20743 [Mesorhizobium plurifarium]|uniref:Uncharacterized protein n=1 Tax=Mesorhizobium plurifarium TaxID=69974 RepID=A0A0K2VYF9_MESPL|nr:hypothetical protein MPL1032_20743 [Mesorhizobium plurifarium]
MHLTYIFRLNYEQFNNNLSYRFLRERNAGADRSIGRTESRTGQHGDPGHHPAHPLGRPCAGRSAA